MTGEGIGEGELWQGLKSVCMKQPQLVADLT